MITVESQEPFEVWEAEVFFAEVSPCSDYLTYEGNPETWEDNTRWWTENQDAFIAPLKEAIANGVWPYAVSYYWEDNEIGFGSALLAAACAVGATEIPVSTKRM